MEIQTILTLIQAFTEHSLTELCVEDGGVKVCLKREAGAAMMEPSVGGPGGTVQGMAAPTMTGGSSPTAMAPSPAPTPSMAQTVGLSGTAGAEIGSDKVVASPLVGIFYSASSPDGEDFVKVGDRVKKGQVLGIIEAMKLMNEIESEYDGVVEEILVHNEDVVEYGQPLFRIR